MSVDGATELDRVEMGAWQQLADEVGFAPRFLAQRMDPFVGRVSKAALDLGELPGYWDPVIGEILAGIGMRVERFGPSA